MTANAPTADQGHVPLATYRYRLTRDDVGAFERLPRELVGRDKLFLLGPALAGGLLLGGCEKEIFSALAVPASVRQYIPPMVLALVLLVPLSYAASAAMLSVRAWWRTQRAHVPATETVVETHDNHFAVTEDGETRGYRWDEVVVVEGERHVFLCPAPRRAIIVPRRAFASDTDMRAFAWLAEAAGRDPDDDHEET